MRSNKKIFYVFNIILCNFSFSFGAMICFAFAEHVKKVFNLEPIHIFLSGASAPYVSVMGFGVVISPISVFKFI